MPHDARRPDLAAAYDASRRQPSQTPNAQACRRRRDKLRAEGLCIFCGGESAASLCARCQRKQGEQRREKCRRRRAELEGTPHALRKYTRRKGRK